ncbi:MAG: UDP-4-amino-4,6-dideoxy-N-acetyl-beta-L-altrosamine transaminase [Waddliaceae bacterium]|nr:UDP-4-amino-4,6-dideoxy-N-acetyl-beta-L-altrosamine transaminase [Waddliaceae bacterium]
MAKNKFLSYGRQTIDPADVREISKALSADCITRGPKVEAFEKALRKQCEAKYAVVFSNGTVALHAAYYAAQVGEFDRIFTSPNTFVGTVTGGILLGANLELLDIDRGTGHLDLKALNQAMLKQYSRGRNIIVPVHYSGSVVDMKSLESCIRDPDTVIIEDAAQALGADYSDGTPVGSCQWSQMTVFSFHPLKTITTGEGGAVTTNDPELYKRLVRFRNNGIERNPENWDYPEEAGPWYYEVHDLTGNYHMTDFQAVLGLSQLSRMKKYVTKRRKLVALYRKAFAEHKHIRLLDANLDKHSAHHLFVIQLDFRRLPLSKIELMEVLKEKDIGTQVHYIPIYRHPFFRRLLGDCREKFPEMERFYSDALTLPLFPDMREGDVRRVVDTVCELLEMSTAVV